VRGNNALRPLLQNAAREIKIPLLGWVIFSLRKWRGFIGALRRLFAAKFTKQRVCAKEKTRI